jgi:hypothetical protein
VMGHGDATRCLRCGLCNVMMGSARGSGLMQHHLLPCDPQPQLAIN